MLQEEEAGSAARFESEDRGYRRRTRRLPARPGYRHEKWWIPRGQRILRPRTYFPGQILAVVTLFLTFICIVCYFFTGRGVRSDPSITFFSALRLNSSSRPEDLTLTELAVRSWLDLSPNVSVVLFGNHPSLFDFAAAFGLRVSIDSAIDFTFLGAPLFHSIIARAQASTSDISVLIDPDTLLFPDFISAIEAARHLKQPWLLLSIPQSFSLPSLKLNQIKFNQVHKILSQNSNPRKCTEKSIIAWNNGNLTLTLKSLVVPPFIYSRGFHNQWLVHEILSNGLRLILYAGRTISSFYPEESDLQSTNGVMWERNINKKLASIYGSYFFRSSQNSSVHKLMRCSGEYLFYKVEENVGYFFSKRAEKRWRNCPTVVENCSFLEWLEVKFKEENFKGLPISLEDILHIRADENKTVVLAISGNNYKDMLMSWVCRMRHVSVNNFVIAAIDADIYNFAVLQGLPVFRDPLAPAEIGIQSCHFGTKCFQRVTKVKSRIVLQILKMGYNVLLSDIDIYWFKDPLPYLRSFDPPVFLAQSDEFNETGPINLPHKLNSGFYFAPADHVTIQTIARVVKHASTSNLSEQPSFYKILCGEGGAHRVNGTHCRDPETNLTIIFLDRDLFPNGAFKGVWEQRDVRHTCEVMGCFILHNNWLTGWDKKVKRQDESVCRKISQQISSINNQSSTHNNHSSDQGSCLIEEVRHIPWHDVFH